MDSFYLVRSPNCYVAKAVHGNLQDKKPTLEMAMRAAIDLASETQRTQLVYEVKLVGRAAIAEATWIPEA